MRFLFGCPTFELVNPSRGLTLVRSYKAGYNSATMNPPFGVILTARKDRGESLAEHNHVNQNLDK
jgi:hypothetical protein